MKKIAFINQRYGLEVNGGSEYYTRLMAERLAGKYEVEVFTTKAIDYVTWENHYEQDTETINNVLVRRFKTDKTRAEDFNKYNEKYLNFITSNERDISMEEKWFEKQGPVSSECIEYIRANHDKYDIFIFVTYLYYLTVKGLPEVSEKAVLIPTAHEEPYIHFKFYEDFFKKPAGFIFLTDEEKELVHKLFNNSSIPCDVMGVGVDVPCVPDESRFREKFGITGDYIIYVGRIDEGKDCPCMFRYFQEYKKRNSNSELKLVLMGKAVCEVPDSQDIISLGFVSEEDKFDGIKGAKALILPSKYESLSISVLEAMSLNIPVIVNGQCHVLKAHCQKSNAGFYYKNYFEFEGIVNYIISHPSEYRMLCENAGKYIEENYRWDVIIKKFGEIIDSI